MTSRSTAGALDAVNALFKAMISADRAALEKWTTDDLRYGHANGHSQTRKEFIDDLVASMGYAEITARNQTVKMIDNIAVVYQDVKRTNRKGGVVDMRDLSVWVFQNNQWKMLARQAAKIKD